MIVVAGLYLVVVAETGAGGTSSAAVMAPPFASATVPDAEASTTSPDAST